MTRTRRIMLSLLLALACCPACTFINVPRGAGTVLVVVHLDKDVSPAMATTISTLGVTALGIPTP